MIFGIFQIRHGAIILDRLIITQVATVSDDKTHKQDK